MEKPTTNTAPSPEEKSPSDNKRLRSREPSPSNAGLALSRETLADDLLEIVERNFWAKVDVRSTHECWLWQGAFGKGDYGMVSIAGRTRKAHRVAYSLCGGTIGSKDLVLHSCDNKRCVNPRHLGLGNHSENLKQAYDRNMRGNDVGQAPV